MENRKIIREIEFHNNLYSRNVREKAEKYYSITVSTRENYASILVSKAGLGKKVLEYGCGEGSYAFDLAATGSTVTGIDISNLAIENATLESRKRGLENVAKFKVMNAEQTSFEDASFDLVCGTSILHI